MSVCIVTYQHARYVAKAIEGALAQTADFNFEILIGEDESTDGTREICQDYARRHPDRIRLYLRSRKDVMLIDGHARGGYNFRATLAEARGEFIAVCEGDDFWNDPLKLQRQVEYLRANAGCAGCFHDTILVDRDGEVIQGSYFQSDTRKFSQRDVLESLMSRYATCSLMFRSTAFSVIPEWFLRRPSDLYLDLLITGFGSLDFLPDNMAAYRKHTGGLWSGQRETNQLIELIIRYKLLLADHFFLQNYRDLLLRKIDEFQAGLFTRSDFVQELGRLEEIVGEQTTALTEAERSRLRLQSFVDQLTAQVANLAATVEQQNIYIATLESASDVSAQNLSTAQASVDRLNQQVADLGATTREQQTYLLVLEGERERLTKEAADALARFEKHEKETVERMELIQRDRQALGFTAQEQAAYIAKLESERSRLTTERDQAIAQAIKFAATAGEQKTYIGASENAWRASEQDRLSAQEYVKRLDDQVANLSATINEQRAYLMALEAERNRLIKAADNADFECQKREKEALYRQEAIQLDLQSLSSTALEQSAYIATLENERKRLTEECNTAQIEAERTSQELRHYATVMAEQLAYIKVLEAQRAEWQATLGQPRATQAEHGNNKV